MMIRAAVVQAAPVAFDREQTLEKVRALAAEAAGEGAQLIVFPEAFVSAYPKGADFGATVGQRTPEGRDAFLRYWESRTEGLRLEIRSPLAVWALAPVAWRAWGETGARKSPG